jgi:hypothetical protein
MWIIVQVECNAKLTSMMAVNGAKDIGKKKRASTRKW